MASAGGTRLSVNSAAPTAPLRVEEVCVCHVDYTFFGLISVYLWL